MQKTFFIDCFVLVFRFGVRRLRVGARNDGKGGSCHCGHRPAISLVKLAMTAKRVAFDGVGVAQQ